MLSQNLRLGEIVKRILIFLLALGMIVLTAKCAVALPDLSVSMPSDIDVFVGEDYFFNMTFSNVGDQDLFNLSFNSIRSTYFPGVNNVSANGSVVLLVRVSPVEVFDENFIIRFSYYYFITEIPSPVQVDVVFDSTGFSSSNVSLYSGDTIRFVNDDVVAGVIKDYNDSFVLNIDSGGVGSHTFDVPGHYLVYHRDYGYVLNVFVANASVGSLAHSNDLDVEVPVHIKSVYPSDELRVRVVTDDMSGDFDKSQSGIVEVKNNGDRTLENVYLRSDWIFFFENNFSLGPGLNRLIDFNVTPVNITKTNMTNLTYELEVVGTARNANVASDALSFFVNYHNFYEIAIGNYSVNIVQLSAEESVALCSQNPSYPGCDKLLIEKPIEKIIEKEPVYAYTENEIKNLKEAQDVTDDAITRIGNKFNVVQEDTETLKNNMSALTKLVGEVADDLKRARSSNFIRNILFWVIFVVITASLAIVLLTKYYRYHKENYENEQEG